MLNAVEMQLQSLEEIVEYLQGVRQAVEETGNDDLIRATCEAASKDLFQTMRAAENNESPTWYLRDMIRKYGDSMTDEEIQGAIEELKERDYSKIPTNEEYRTALHDMIDSVEAAAYDLLKTCGIYSRVLANADDGTAVLYDFSGEVENSAREILDAIIEAGEVYERFMFNIERQNTQPEPPKWMTLHDIDPEYIAREVEDGNVYTGNYTADLV